MGFKNEHGQAVVERDGLGASGGGSLSPDRARQRHRPSWIGLVVAVVAGVGGFFVLQRFDVAILRWRGGFMPLELDSFGDQILGGFKNFAQPLTIGVVLVLVALYDQRWKRIILAVLLAQLAAKLSYDVLKSNVARQRPSTVLKQMEADPGFSIEQTWTESEKGDARWGLKSFPSGHSAAAFALAGVLAMYYGRAAGLWWLLALGCAATRILHAVHWPSDTVVGAMIGYLAAQVGLWVASWGRRR